MSRKKIIIIISIVLVVLIGGAIWLLTANESFFQKKQPAATETSQQSAEQAKTNFPVAVDSEQGTVKKDFNSAEQTIYLVARNFSERLSSFSSDTESTNIEEIKGITASALYQKLLQAGNKTDLSAGYYGVSSKALRIEILKSDEQAGTATVLVGLQRSETIGQAQPIIYNQNLLLSLTKAGDKWLVSEADWQ